MGATGTELDRSAAVRTQTLAVVRQLLTELGASRGLEELSARGPAAHLERELELGSLERVEVMLRLNGCCGIRLPDRMVADADTLQDLIDAILATPQTETRLAHTARVASPPSPTPIPGLEEQIAHAPTITEILRLRGLGEPGRTHIHLYDEGGEPCAITFGELYTRALRVAADLQSHGFEPGQTAAIMLPTCAGFFYTFAGILLAGGIPVPIYPPFRADRIAEYAERQSAILRNAEVRFLVTFRQAEGLARLLKPRVPTLHEVLNAERLASAAFSPGSEVPSGNSRTEWHPVETLSHSARPGDIAFLQYTSGSTGDPKGVTLTHANLLANIHSIVEGIGLAPEDVAVSWLPLYHDMGLIGAWLVPLFSGNPVIVMSPLAFLSRPERWLWAIHRHRGTMSPAPNFAFELCVRKIAEEDLQGLDLSSWRAALNGAETVRADTIERFVARFSPYGFRRESLLPVYGLAEATLGVSVSKIGSGYKVDRIERTTFESEGRAVPVVSGGPEFFEFVSAGKPLPKVEVRIVTNDGRDVGERAEGRLWFRGPSATGGYYRNDSATRELIRDGGWLDSGDLAYLADGEVYITGRAKDVIIKGGRNLYPHEIEDIAGRVKGVRTGCVVAFGVPDERSGTERLVVAAEVRNLDDGKSVAAEIASAVSNAIGIPPDRVEILPTQSIPKTSSGKLRRSETRRLFLERKLGRKLAPPWVQVMKLAARSSFPRAWELIKRFAWRAVEILYGAYALAACGLAIILISLGILMIPSRKSAARFLHAGMRFALLIAGVPVRVVGREVLGEMTRSRPWIFAPNHSSYLDIVVNLAVLPGEVRYVVKGEALRMPLFGAVIRRTGQFAFDRGDPRSRIRQAEEVDAALKNGDSVVIYPEGTFTATVGIRPFQLGAFKAAVDTQRPICPVAVRGARHVLRDRTYLPKPGRITVTFGPLVAPDRAASDEWHEILRLRDETRDIIARNSGEPLL